MSFGNMEMLEQYQAKQVEQSKSSSYAGGPNDSRMIKFKAGKTYKFKLIYWVPTDEAGKPTVDRLGPFIDMFTHSYKDEESGKSGRILCPTTKYVDGNKGFSKCPVCSNNSKLWDDWDKNRNTVSKALYSKLKRRFNGYAIVYVEHDPSNEENNGTLKIMRYGIKIHQFLQKNIFGIDAKGNVSSDEEVYGASAFNLKDSYSLVVPVTLNSSESGTYNNYDDIKFAMKPTSINIDQKKLVEDIKALNFDEDFYLSYNEGDSDEFYKDFVVGRSISQSSTTTASDDTAGAIQSLLDSGVNVASDESTNESVDSTADIAELLDTPAPAGVLPEVSADVAESAPTETDITTSDVEPSTEVDIDDIMAMIS
jgi:hypothetical protein